MIKNLLETAHMSGFYDGRRPLGSQDISDSQRFLEQYKEAYRENLEFLLETCQMATNTLGDYSISPDRLRQAMAWLRGEIGELK